MSVFANAACLLIITLGVLQASRSAVGLQLASYHSLLVTATLALVMATSLYAPSTIAFVRLPLGTLLVALVVSASLNFIYMKLFQHHVLPLRRLKNQTIFATGNATATSLLASPVLAQDSGVFTLLAVPLLGITFYLILVLLTPLRETMRLRTAASSLSSSIAASMEASLDSTQTRQPASHETGHALMACAVIALCVLALAGSL